MNSDEQEIRALVKQWMYATKTGDSVAILNLIADDAMFLVPGQEPFGKPAFATASQSDAHSSGAIEGTSEILDLEIAGDWAFMVSKLRVEITRPDGQPTARAGHTLTVLQKVRGTWKIVRDANLLMPMG